MSLILKITAGMVYFTIDHFNLCMHANSGTVTIHDQMSSDVQSET